MSVSNERVYQAALNNPQVSEQAKEHAQQAIDEISRNDLPKEHELINEDKDEVRVNAGYKATLKSTSSPSSIPDIRLYPSLDPQTSQEAKDHAKGILEEKGAM